MLKLKILIIIRNSRREGEAERMERYIRIASSYEKSFSVFVSDIIDE
jgi:hypothetical protein